MKKLTFLISVLAFASILFGCSTSAPKNSAGRTETCYVCKYNNDLGCVHFQVTPTTPQTVFGNHTYYFCSEDCLKAFLKKPERYYIKAT